MRIGFFTDSYLPRADGIAISVEEYRAGLAKLGHTVFVFCPKRPEPFIEPSDSIYRFRSLPSVVYEDYRDTFPFSRKHVKFVNSLNLDLIHTFTPMQIGLFGVYIAKRSGTPLVSTCNIDIDLVKEYRMLGVFAPVIAAGTSISSNKLMSRSNLKRLLKPSRSIDRWLERMVGVTAAFYNDQCDIVTVQSEKMKKAIDPYMKKPTVVLPVGTDLNLVPKNPSVKSIRNRFGLPLDHTLFISSCRLVKEKRVDFLIRAYAKLSVKDKEKSALVIVGEGPLGRDLKKLSHRLGLDKNVFFTGLIDHKQVFEIVSSSDIYIHASLRETQGLVLNEAAACGKPLIMIDKIANPVLKDRENGFFSENNINDFSRKMKILLNDEERRVKYGKASKKRAIVTSQENVSKKLDNLYKSINITPTA